MTNPKRWTLNATALAGLVERAPAVVAHHSPLRDWLNSSEDEPPAHPPIADDDLARAGLALAEPSAAHGLLGPSGGQPLAWYYRGAGLGPDVLIGFDSSNLPAVISVVRETDIWQEVRATLTGDAVAESAHFRFELSWFGFLALIATIDADRARAMKAMLERIPRAPASFEVQEIADAAFLSCAARDIRWLSGLMQQLIPLSFDWEDNAYAVGLSELVDLGLVQREGDLVQLGDQLREVALSLATPVSWCALTTWVWSPVPSRSHVVAIRGLGALWIIAFPDGLSEGATVVLHQGTIEDVELELTGELFRTRPRKPAHEEDGVSHPEYTTLDIGNGPIIYADLPTVPIPVH